MTRFASTESLGTGNTWGISGSTFLLYYATAAAVIAVLALYALIAGFTDRVDAPSGQLPAEEVAYLAGGGRQACITALTVLRALGLVAGGGRGRIVATGAAGQPLSELQLAVLEASAGGARTPAVLTDRRVRAALDNIRNSLQARGLLVGQGRIHLIRLLPRLALLLVVLGFARFASGFLFGRPVRDLLLTMGVVALVGILVRLAGRIRTAAGTELIRRLQADNGHLRNSENPSWATYGAMGAGLSVALFGATSLFAFDPVFAAEAAIPRYAGFAGGTSGLSSDWSNGGTSWSDSGLGFGGDSGGSGCGGGSSCGGGGCGG